MNFPFENPNNFFIHKGADSFFHFAQALQTSSLLSNSKKIKKVKVSKQDQDPSSSINRDGKKYETVNSKTKNLVLLDLKRGIVSMKGLNLEPKAMTNSELLELLDDVELTSYNTLLTLIIKKHFPKLETNTKVLTLWRRKIKGWANSADKPENRGGLLVPYTMLGIFREKVINVLHEMKARSFPELRQKILNIVEELQGKEKLEKLSKECNGHICSKHWWFTFLKKNQDIREMWEIKPLKKTIPKMKRDIFWKAIKEKAAKEKNKDIVPKPKLEALDENVVEKKDDVNVNKKAKVESFFSSPSIDLKAEDHSTEVTQECVQKREEDSFQGSGPFSQMNHMKQNVKEEAKMKVETQEPRMLVEENSFSPNMKMRMIEEEPITSAESKNSSPSPLPNSEFPTNMSTEQCLQVLYQKRKMIDMYIFKMLEKQKQERMVMNPPSTNTGGNMSMNGMNMNMMNMFMNNFHQNCHINQAF